MDAACCVRFESSKEGEHDLSRWTRARWEADDNNGNGNGNGNGDDDDDDNDGPVSAVAQAALGRVLRTGDLALYRQFVDAGLYNLRAGSENSNQRFNKVKLVIAAIDSGSLSFVQEEQSGASRGCDGPTRALLILPAGLFLDLYSNAVAIALKRCHVEIALYLFEIPHHSSKPLDEASALKLTAAAAEAGCIEIVQWFADNGFEMFSRKWRLNSSPIYLAAAARHKEIVKVLLDCGQPGVKLEHALKGAQDGGHADIEEMCKTLSRQRP
ncbi:hypothetical protein HDU89_002949 [Geranomyces variabilis]|nr:hypothetical protein HDU89_002949 [Geranomyces variabilis]